MFAEIMHTGLEFFGSFFLPNDIEPFQFFNSLVTAFLYLISLGHFDNYVTIIVPVRFESVKRLLTVLATDELLAIDIAGGDGRTRVLVCIAVPFRVN
jgi:hypothetical protein